ncbi:orotidine-5'-phosphate decarboxylase [Candidatus Palibaumannia cicadellinicola]|uniref:Orotidine 5'-phosphate decarboxylase n=1 Tax=Candidatus Palibaumannia cicadellinicola TaxID=186490 RepID=A0A088MXY1_9GAMM|nr:orotidine-5'-phosphate decarboxylase [Candidatus Baumannia cicadellinicola]AIN47215.1 Orotidine 5'-phosphate decarboxylase [Candidatus Baumannia cicadellinicola]
MTCQALPLSTYSPLIVALDYAHASQALAFADLISPQHCRLKIGQEMFTRFGPALIIELQQRGFDIFLDLKFHDIPNTVARTVSAVADLGVWMVNIHASGGEKMMVAARNALANFGPGAPRLIGVTVLTSISDNDLQILGIQGTTTEFAIRLAILTKNCGLDGVVCSAQEAVHIKAICGHNFTIVTPGIRLAFNQMADHDHCRVMTAQQAQQAGVDYMVIGRPITQAAEPHVVLWEILRSLKQSN